VILAYAGRRARSLGCDPDTVAPQVRQLLGRLQPDAVVGAAADGADLLVLEAALSLPDRPTAHVFLPTARDVFREHSVDAEWRDRFDRALRAVEHRGGLVASLDMDDGEEAYRRANQVILEQAAALAGVEQRRMVLVIAREGEGAMIEDLLQRAATSGVRVLRIDPSAHASS
jgi:hypothetical protein